MNGIVYFYKYKRIVLLTCFKGAQIRGKHKDKPISEISESVHISNCRTGIYLGVYHHLKQVEYNHYH